MNRKGDWIQLFLIAFFFLLLLIAILLLFAQKSRITVERPQFDDDVAYEIARTALLAVLHTPMEVDLNGDEKNEKATVADALLLGKITKEEFGQHLPQTSFYALTIDGTTFTNVPKGSFGPGDRGEIVYRIFRERAPKVTITLHTKQLTFQYADPDLILYYVSQDSRYDGRERNYNEQLVDESLALSAEESK